MEKAEILRFAKIALQDIESRWGKRWRAMLSPDMQTELVGSAVLRIVLNWINAERIPSSDVQKIAQVAYKLIVPESRA